MAMVVWVMMGIAVWHFTVFLPDRFWGGIVGAFLAAFLGAVIVGFLANGLTVPGQSDTDIVQALIAIPGAMIGLAISTGGARAWTARTASTTARPGPARTSRPPQACPVDVGSHGDYDTTGPIGAPGRVRRSRDFAEELPSSARAKPRDVAAGGEIREEPVVRHPLGVVEGCPIQPPEPPLAIEGFAPSPRPIAAHHRQVRAAALQQIVEQAKPGALATFPRRRVPQQGKPGARLQHARDLIEGAAAVEPVEGLGGENRIGARIRRGMRSAVPRSACAAGAARASCCFIAASGSIAITSSKHPVRSRVSLPVPAARSTTMLRRSR